jgi:hypothetical protein
VVQQLGASRHRSIQRIYQYDLDVVYPEIPNAGGTQDLVDDTLIG